MQPHEQAQFLSAISKFVQEQVSQAVQFAAEPLLLKIEELESQLALRPVLQEDDVVERAFDAVVKNFRMSGEFAQSESLSRIVEHERVQTGEALLRISDIIKQMQDKIETWPVPKDGKDAVFDVSVVRELIDQRVETIIKSNKEVGLLCDFDDTVASAEIKARKMIDDAIAALPVFKDGVDGKDAEIPWDFLNEQLSAGMEMLSNQLNKKMESIPVPRDGVDGKDGKDGVDGTDGKDGVDGKAEVVDYLRLGDIVKDFLPRYFEVNPVKDGKDGADGADGKDGASGADGRDVDLDDLHKFIASSVSDAVDAIPASAVPVNVVGGYIDRDGNLCHTLSDGTIKILGIVVGRDGKDVDLAAVREKIEELYASTPKPLNGKDGKDGKDGVGFEAMSIVRIDERNFELIVANEDGSNSQSFPFSVDSQVNRGFWKEDVVYTRGDLVTLGGSQWCCMVEHTMMRPETGDGNDWHLSVKRGRDGKQGTPGPKGEKGIDGRDGRDLTQLGFDGGKH